MKKRTSISQLFWAFLRPQSFDLVGTSLPMGLGCRLCASRHPSPSLGLPFRELSALLSGPLPHGSFSGLNFRHFRFRQRFFSLDIPGWPRRPTGTEQRFPSLGSSRPCLPLPLPTQTWLPSALTAFYFTWSSPSKSLPSKSVGDDRHVSRSLLLETMPPLPPRPPGEQQQQCPKAFSRTPPRPASHQMVPWPRGCPTLSFWEAGLGV